VIQLTLFLGWVLNPEISKITVEYANTKRDAEIMLSFDKKAVKEEWGTFSAYLLTDN